LALIGDNIEEKDIKIFEQFSYALIEGILSTPMNNLRKELAEDNKNKSELINLALKLFNYEKI
jgi:glutamyl-tRNA reductase